LLTDRWPPLGCPRWQLSCAFRLPTGDIGERLENYFADIHGMSVSL
jgi:hypothetical protein